MSNRVTTACSLSLEFANGERLRYQFKPREVYQRDDKPTQAFLRRLRAFLLENGHSDNEPFMICDNWNIWLFNGYDYEYGVNIEW